jgi:hypothetical protein
MSGDAKPSGESDARLLTDAEMKWLNEVLNDAREKLHRLSAWERGFIGDLAHNWYPGAIIWRMSDKQMAVLRRIEAKIYAAG